MAHADPEATKAYKKAYRKKNRPIFRESERKAALARWRAMGLEPVDANDPMSDLECRECGKVTKRISQSRKHELWCSYDGVYVRKNAPLKEIPGHYEAKY